MKYNYDINYLFYLLMLNKIYINFRGCDACEEWYHGDCINITEKDAKHIKQFFCIVRILYFFVI